LFGHFGQAIFGEGPVRLRARRVILQVRAPLRPGRGQDAQLPKIA
jgi:hypothetical protein